MSLKLHSWMDRDGLPVLPGIDEAATRRLVEAASRDTLEPHELDAIRAFCSGLDASNWLWELLDRWQFKGAGEHVMRRLFGWLATDGDVSRLGEMLRQRKPWTDHVWARIAPRHRALDLLAAVNRPLGWLEILRFHDTTRIDDLYKAADALLYDRARRDGVLPRDVGDLCAPTHALPAQRAEILDRGIGRLEQAMVVGRRWQHRQWRDAWVEHPILTSLVGQVIWIAHTDDGSTAFMLSAEDGAWSPTATISLDAAFEIEVAHPTQLDVSCWSDVFADLEIVQPFEQLGRRTRTTTRPRVLDPDVLVQAKRWGWEMRARVVGPTRDLFVLEVGGIAARIVVDPGISVSSGGRVLAKQRLQRLSEIEVVDTAKKEVVPAKSWPARVRMELDVLLARAAAG